jgi:hypothetical protein
VGLLVEHLDAEQVAHARMVTEGCLTCQHGRDYKQMLKTLTEAQERCTQLLEEVRRLKGAPYTATLQEPPRYIDMSPARYLGGG